VGGRRRRRADPERDGGRDAVGGRPHAGGEPVRLHPQDGPERLRSAGRLPAGADGLPDHRVARRAGGGRGIRRPLRHAEHLRLRPGPDDRPTDGSQRRPAGADRAGAGRAGVGPRGVRGWNARGERGNRGLAGMVALHLRPAGLQDRRRRDCDIRPHRRRFLQHLQPHADERHGVHEPEGPADAASHGRRGAVGDSAARKVPAIAGRDPRVPGLPRGEDAGLRSHHDDVPERRLHFPGRDPQARRTARGCVRHRGAGAGRLQPDLLRREQRGDDRRRRGGPVLRPAGRLELHRQTVAGRQSGGRRERPARHAIQDSRQEAAVAAQPIVRPAESMGGLRERQGGFCRGPDGTGGLSDPGGRRGVRPGMERTDQHR